MNTSRLELREIEHRAADANVLRAVNLDLTWSGVVVIAGPSGAGKTSLLRLLNRLDAPTSGDVLWDGRSVDSEDPCQLRRRVGYIAQNPVVFEGSALDNLRVGAPDLTLQQGQQLLDRVGLADKGNQDASTLSGGEAQRLCLARTLATEPQVILADEPTAPLDTDATARIEALALDLADNEGVRWVWVSHHPAQIRRLADIVVVMDAGTIVGTGTVEELTTVDHPAIHNALGMD